MDSIRYKRMELEGGDSVMTVSPPSRRWAVSPPRRRWAVSPPRMRWTVSPPRRRWIVSPPRRRWTASPQNQLPWQQHHLQAVKIAPAIFQTLMEEVLQSLEGFVRAYMDDLIIFSRDIIIFSRSWKEHEGHIRQVLQALRSARLTANPTKCQ